MTVANTNNRKDYTGNNTTAVYSFDFVIFAETDLKVYEDGVLLGLTTDYTVTADTDLDDGPSTGHITLVAGNLGTGVALTILRDVPQTQGVALSDNDSFPAETIEKSGLDRLTILCQQLQEQLDRAPKLDAFSTESDISLADLDGNTGKFARVNTAEDGLEFADIAATSGSLGDPVSVSHGGTAGTTPQTARDNILTDEDARTNSSFPFTLKATTSGTPAAGIGTALKMQAESADETPSDVLKLEGAFSDVTAGSEDSYFQVFLRVAGAALSAAYKFVTTTAFKAIFSHANTADRTYTLPDETGTLGIKGTITYKSGGGGGNYTRSSATLANVDGTNLALTVTIPTGWKLLVNACGVLSIAAATTSAILALRDGAAGTIYAESQMNLATAGNAYGWSLTAAIAGDGASHTVVLQFASSDGATVVTIPNVATNFPTMTFLLAPSN